MEQLDVTCESRGGKRSLGLMRKSAELSLSNAMLRAVFDGTRSLVVILDTQGLVIYANRFALGYVGASLEQVVNVPFEDTGWWNHNPGQVELLRDAITRANDGEIMNLEITQRAMGGDLRTVDFVLTPFRDESGAVVWLVPEGRDITDLRRLEIERNDFEQRLHHSERLESIGRLTGGVAHDFNNLLTVMGSGLEMLKTEENIEPLNLEILDDMNEAVHGATALTRQLLAFSRKQVNDSEVFEVDQRVQCIAKVWRRVLSKSIRLNVELNAPRLQVQMPIGNFEQIVVNLIVNAQHSMPKGGSMTLRTEIRSFDSLPRHAFGQRQTQGRHVVTTLTDTGSGMSSDTLKRAFDLFFTTKAKGTGFGLATVYGLVTQAGGFVTLESTQGKGTRVSICLPLLEQSYQTVTLAPEGGDKLSSAVL